MSGIEVKGNMIHELKCWPKFFAALQNGEKTFELRYNDRDFKEDDRLLLREWEPVREDYTAASPLRFVVTHVMHGPLFGLEAGWCIMSIKPVASDWHLP